MMIMGGALLFAVIVALGVTMKMSPKEQPKEVVATGTDILVASKDLPIGQILKEEDVAWVNFPDALLFGGVIKKKDQADPKKIDVAGKPLKRDVRSGEPVTTQALVDSHGNYLAANLQPGMRAVAIPVRPETMAGGFVSPGDYVDVILIFQVSLKGDAENYSADTVQRFASETILSNVHVLAVDQDTKDDTHEASKQARTVTLEVDKHATEVLSMASTMGQLTLALRRLGEKDTESDLNDQFTTDVNTSKVIQKIYKTQALGGSKSSDTNVRVYSGNSVTNVPVRPDTQRN